MRTYSDRRLLGLVTLVVAPVTSVRAEKPDMSVEELRKTATHIVTGTVIAIYQRTERKGNDRYTNYVAEVRVIDCEKGCDTLHKA